MEKAINFTENGFEVTENDNFLTSILADIANNNTAFPAIKDVYIFKKNVKLPETDKDGKRKRVVHDAMRVTFADGSWTDVVKSDGDDNDPMTALLYAIVKRLMGRPTEAGYVEGSGFMGTLKNILASARSEESENRKKAERIAAKEAEDKKIHQKALERRNANPSIGNRLRNLEDKFTKFLETFSRGSIETKKAPKKEAKKQPRQKNGRFAHL